MKTFKILDSEKLTKLMTTIAENDIINTRFEEHDPHLSDEHIILDHGIYDSESYEMFIESGLAMAAKLIEVRASSEANSAAQILRAPVGDYEIFFFVGNEDEIIANLKREVRLDLEAEQSVSAVAYFMAKVDGLSDEDASQAAFDASMETGMVGTEGAAEDVEQAEKLWKESQS